MTDIGFIVRCTDYEGSDRWTGPFNTIQEINNTIKALREKGATNIEYFRLVKDLLS